MPVTRRNFLKLSGATAAGAFLGGTSFLTGCGSTSVDKLKGAKESTTICPYCGVGCGLIVSTRGGKIINIEGDPDHPINQGSLCAKGNAIYQIAINPIKRRLDKVQYRRPGGDKWEEISWDQAIKMIARRVKDTRDKTFIEKDNNGVTVNRASGLFSLGGAALDNEECYLVSKFARLLGITYLEHQARLCHSSTVAGLAATFGRGIMTNHWIDIKNADVILVMGSNPAENHPISFRWIQKARDNGAKLIVVDPRFTRTASLADLYGSIRPGTDLAFLGGIINYILQNDRIQRDYVVEYTNAAYLVHEGYSFKDGLFSGYDAAKRSYDRSTWTYQLDEKGIPKQDKSLKDKRCVYQLMKEHYSRYTPEVVEKITGCPKETFLEIADLFTSTHKPDKVATILYAMGTTQHTVGTQNIRAYGIIQLLLGNIGLAGGGINAMRGESNVQGSTDAALLWHILPGYNPVPEAAKHKNLEEYFKAVVPKSNDPMSINWWQHRPKYVISMLKAWFGDAATKDNDFCFDWLPKAEKPTPHIVLFEDMYAGKLKGGFLWGTNTVVGGPNSAKEAKALEKLDWLVAIDLWETDTSIYWKENYKNVKTEVFLLPAASSVEKEGSITNSGRWAQWRYKAMNPPGDAKSDLEIVDLIFNEVRQLYKKENGKFPDPIVKANWNYTHEGHHEPDPELVAREINGYDWKSKKQLDSFMDLKDDGTTACGNWIYGGSFTEKGNLMKRRGLDEGPGNTGLYPEWAWAWPLNRRIAYNRAAVNRKGEPWDPKRWFIKWTGSQWKGDVVDGGAKFGPEAKNPFIMNSEGVGKLFSNSVVDGPLTEHYEPMESPFVNILNSQKVNPASLILDSVKSEFGNPSQFPYVGTSYRLVEHWQAGAMTRNLPWLNELVPDMFCEISPSLAKKKNIKTGDMVKIKSQRGNIKARALVTERIQPWTTGGKEIEMVGMVWHFGHGCAASGDSCNILTPHIGDANTMIPEYKAFLVDIEKA
jgi:formate dehydrogenase major subunit